ncbi:MAG: ATP-dependent Clp protease adaptor ClpS [Treponema sp.]|jgi:ATP-dependent Clp protease adaptor protein ClpS|nr:ATP-dependent Clp protease adaptor ClpS [Treponema sp.]MBQ2553012.1 ATP-dependent Clp protease adaptor ClpS [Treponema sp.]MBQ4237441.1 ATP-dependent Clp protease adaptor ClpS [Treponema sp.]MBQ5383818.1 ATP-dependent Clp protease adaptor ClpS [Treponema sp.]
MAYRTDFSFSGAVKEDIDIKPPSSYKVIFFNDDYTTKEFVVQVLKQVFHKNSADAVKIMESVHTTGRGIAGVYPYDIALTRKEMTVSLARKEGFPLRCELEEN